MENEDKSIGDILDELDNESINSNESKDSDKKVQSIMKFQMSQQIRKSLNVVQQSMNSEKLVVKDIQTQLQFQMDLNLKKKMHNEALKKLQKSVAPKKLSCK